MIASSPVRHESSIGVAALEVHAYQPPWKALSDFALHTDLDRLDTNAPSFHNLVSQVMCCCRRQMISLSFFPMSSVLFVDRASKHSGKEDTNVPASSER